MTHPIDAAEKARWDNRSIRCVVPELPWLTKESPGEDNPDESTPEGSSDDPVQV